MDEEKGECTNHDDSYLTKKKAGDYILEKIIPCCTPFGRRLNSSPIMNGKVAPQQDVSQVYNGTESFFKVAFEFWIENY